MLICENVNQEQQRNVFDYVFDTSGNYSNHRLVGDGGLPAGGERSLEAKKRLTYVIPDVLQNDRKRFEKKVFFF